MWAQIHRVEDYSTKTTLTYVQTLRSDSYTVSAQIQVNEKTCKLHISHKKEIGQFTEGKGVGE